MANTVSSLSYANTFGQQMITVNQLVAENNNLASSNYYKSTGTLFLNDPTTGLSVAANTIVGANFLTSSATVQNLLWAQGAVRVDNLVTLTNTVSSLVSAGPVTLNSSGNALIVANNTSLSTLYVSNNAVITNNILVSNSVFVTNNVSVTKTITSNVISANTVSTSIANVISNLFVGTVGYIPTLQSNSSVISPVINSTSTTYTNSLQANSSVNTAALSASSGFVTSLSTNLIYANIVTSNVVISTPSLVAGSNVISNVLQANNSVNTSVVSASLVTSNTLNANNVVQTKTLNVTGTDYVDTVSANTTITTPRISVSNLIDANSASAFFGSVTAQGQFSVVGNFILQGSTIYNSNSFTINANATSGATSSFNVNRGISGTNATIRWNESGLYWDIVDVSTNNYNKIITSDLLSNSLISTSNSTIATSFVANTLNNSIINNNNVNATQNTRLSTVEANTIFINGVDASQNTRLSNLETGLAANITYIAGIDASQNTRIGNLETGLGANVTYIAGIDASQNTRLSTVESNLSANIIYIAGIDASQNTRLSTVEANTIFINGIDNAQNTRLSTVESNTINISAIDNAQNTRLSTVEANTIYLQGALNTTNVTDYTSISVSSPGIYGGTTAIPVVNIAANGRIISISNTTITAGATITDDITTNATRYVMLGSANSGAYLIANTSSSKLYFNPSTGTLSSTIFSSLSDKELKENIRHLESCTDTINLINPVEFTWKDSGKKSYGVIAQELEKILPELINESDGIKSVEYNSLIAFLLGAVKELSERVSVLESK